MIGLRSGRVELQSRHEQYEAEYQRMHAELLKELSGVATIEHIGSTAVPGLPAKPIIDVAVGWHEGVAASQLMAVCMRVGYRDRGFREDAGGYIADYVVGDLTTRHLHFVEFGSTQWKRYLAFREFLRHNYAARADYSKVKAELAAQFPYNRRDYTRSKRAYVERVTDKAMEWSCAVTGTEEHFV